MDFHVQNSLPLNYYMLHDTKMVDIRIIVSVITSVQYFVQRDIQILPVTQNNYKG